MTSRAGGRAAAASRPRSRDPVRWPELKLDIVSRYASAYSRVLSRQPGLAHYYIDGLAAHAAGGPARARPSVPGSTLSALRVTPPFRHHYLVDADRGRLDALRAMIGDRDDVTFLHGDPGAVLLEHVLPRVRSEDYRRALCVLDPCGLALDWRVIERAGRLGTLDLFVHLPVAGANGEPLWTRPGSTAAPEARRLTRFWGDESWRETASGPESRNGHGGARAPGTAAAVVRAFHRRLREVARFANVPEPLALHDGAGAVVSHLFFAARADTANAVVGEIFARHRDGGGRAPGRPA